MKIFYLLPFFMLTTAMTCQSTSKNAPPQYPTVQKDSIPPQTTFSEKMRGITVVAPQRAFEQDQMDSVRATGANFIALVPYGFTQIGEPHVQYGKGWQWWGERPEGVRGMSKMAHAAGLKVLLKPQVYVPSGWPGSIFFEKEADAQQWENEYEKFIMIFVEIAVEEKIDAFCVGTEFRQLEVKRPQFWRNLIQKIRKKYSGQLTYSANWDSFEEVPFWDALDFVGTNAYFPLVEKDTPPVSELCEAWKPIAQRFQTFYEKVKKPICFTEYGYLTVNGAAGKTWLLEKDVKKRTINQHAQANAYEALFRTFGEKKYWNGGFVWKWFPKGMGHEGYPERDYTPQQKQAQQVLTKFYSF
ncbi:MAG: hypothetical protein RL757_2891 [Bacteroidota bacterium]|jgi:hypothetical protein